MAKSAMAGTLKSLCASRSALLLCDMQERFGSHILGFDAITENCRRAVRACTMLGIPIIVTEQYPKGLGHTIPALRSELLTSVIEKTRFSMAIDEVRKRIADVDATNLIIVGIEAHVCVLQSVIDFVKEGYIVHLPVDAISSRSKLDRKIGLKRARQSGAFVTTTESMMYQLCEDAKHPQFKQIQGLFKDLMDLGID